MTAQRRKFGAFGGVFTPSILTILGVIMYLRLPAIVGQAGMWGALGIIAAAHIISVTTGLSVSSISTDKRVKAGGSYFIISRSLGLPIGGTLGIALFVGLSFGVSLYLIGFAESLLSFFQIGIDPVTGHPDINTIRLTGSIALATVTTITFISTSLAIKTQYLIMAAIALSLLSIFIGNSDQAAPAVASFEPLADAAPLVVLFGIFFPAVTGFEAGVSMSGDLKNPRRDIPRGTLYAVGTGFAVYVLLAIFLAFRIPADQLAHNPRVLLDYAYFAPLVVAGIWGATISSALGSILGAPRILQACALDGIAPRLFGKGVGVDNEPRNALLLAALIAEGGILIGSLDAIAGIVSMFFMAAYGVLNLSAAVESWTSPDFRPDFRIPRLVSVIGAIACFVLMLELDMLAMVGAFSLMGLLYAWLKRKELALEGGDTWTGIWAATVRKALGRLSRERTHQRNWRPNLLLFSGTEHPNVTASAIGRALIQRTGVLTEVELARPDDGSDATSDPPASGGALDTRPEGTFVRRVSTRDVYSTIAAISRYHGVVGLEPNTAFIDWRLLREDLPRAKALLAELTEIDRNLILIPSDPHPTDEPSGRIDVWWRGDGRNLALGLALVRGLTAAEGWRRASPRFIVAVGDPGLRRLLEQRLAAWLRDARVTAEALVLDAPEEPTGFADLVVRTSAGSDLVIVSARSPAHDDTLADELAVLVSLRRPLLLVRANSAFVAPFQRADLEFDAAERPPSADDLPADAEPPSEPTATSDDAALDALVRRYHAELSAALSHLHEDCVTSEITPTRHAVAAVERTLDRAFNQLERASALVQPARRHRTVHRIEHGMLRGLDSALSELRVFLSETLSQTLRAALGALADELVTIERQLDDEITLSTVASGAEARAEAEARAASRGLLARLRARREFTRWPLRRFVMTLHSRDAVAAIRQALEGDRDALDGRLTRLDALVGWATAAVADQAGALAEATGPGEIDVTQARAELRERVAAWRRVADSDDEALERALSGLARDLSGRLAAGLADPLHARASHRPADAPPFDADELAGELSEAASLQHYRVQRLELDVALETLHLALRLLVHDTVRDLERRIDHGVLVELDSFADALRAMAAGAQVRPLEELTPTTALSFEERLILGRLNEAIEQHTEPLPESVTTLSEPSFEALRSGQLDELDEITIALRRLVSFILKTDLLGRARESLADIAAAVHHANNTVRDVARLVAFGVGMDASEAERAVLEEEREEIFRGGVERIEAERAQVERAWRTLAERLPALLDRVIERTRMVEIGRSAGSLDRFIRTSERAGVREWTRRRARALRDGVRRGMVGLSYRWSRGVVVARRLRHSDEEPASPVERIIGLHRASTPTPEVWQALPIFYRQIFLGRAAADPAYQLDESEGQRAANDAVDVHAAGHPGALWITGPPGSGVGALIRRVVQGRFDKERHFTIRPVDGGSIDPGRFDEELARALGVHKSADDALATLPANSVVVVEDLELWWERSPGGLAVLERLEGLIERHGARTLFVLGVNEYVMRLLRRLGLLTDQALATVHCRPLDALRLGQAVMLRHDATGLGLRLEGESRELNEWKTARLFSGLFEYSGGYIGAALSAWIAHISAVTPEHIVVRRPRAADLSVFDGLDPSWVALLAELAMHRRADRQRLSRITGLGLDRLERILTGLARAGLLASDDGVIGLDRFTAPHITRWLSARGIL